MESIKIGTCVRGNSLLEDLPEVIKNGFDTVELYYNETIGQADFMELAPKVHELLDEPQIRVSTIGLYCNPFQEESQKELEYCIKNAHRFGATVVSTFAGAFPGKTVFEAIPKFKQVFTELTKLAEDCNVKLAIENATMYGNWYHTTCNIGFCARAWEMMFDAVPSDWLGLEWEPSHQLEQLADVETQLRAWLPKIVHVHGKDATIDREHIAMYGAWFGEEYCKHRFPGLGDSDWTKIIQILQQGGYQGDICIEGFHDPVYNGEREMEGQVQALHYLKRCMNSIPMV